MSHMGEQKSGEADSMNGPDPGLKPIEEYVQRATRTLHRMKASQASSFSRRWGEGTELY